MTTNQEERVIEALVAFIERVAEGKATSETEIEVLPKVAEALATFRD